MSEEEKIKRYFIKIYRAALICEYFHRVQVIYPLRNSNSEHVNDFYKMLKMMKRDTRPLAYLHTVFLGFLNIFMFGSANENIDCSCKTIEFLGTGTVLRFFNSSMLISKTYQ